MTLEEAKEALEIAKSEAKREMCITIVDLLFLLLKLLYLCLTHCWKASINNLDKTSKTSYTNSSRAVPLERLMF